MNSGDVRTHTMGGVWLLLEPRGPHREPGWTCLVLEADGRLFLPLTSVPGQVVSLPNWWLLNYTEAL